MKEVQGSSGTFDPIPKNRYDVKCLEAKKTIVETSGNEMVEAMFEITGPSYEGRRLWTNFVWTPQTAWKIKQALESAESDLINDEDLTIDKFTKALNMGLAFNTLVEIRTYINKAGETVKTNEMKNFTKSKSGVKKASSSSVFQ